MRATSFVIDQKLRINETIEISKVERNKPRVVRYGVANSACGNLEHGTPKRNRAMQPNRRQLFYAKRRVYLDRCTRFVFHVSEPLRKTSSRILRPCVHTHGVTPETILKINIVWYNSYVCE